MAIGTVTWAAAVVGTTGSLTPAQPSPAAGDLLLCFCYDFAQLTSWTQPSGWSTHKNVAVASSGTYAIFYKVATGSEGTATITCAATGTGNSRLARICKVPGAGSSLTAGTQEAETTSSYANAGVTPATNGSLVVFFGGTKDCITNSETDGFGTPSGGTNLGAWSSVSNGTTGGSDAAMGIGTALQTTATATGSIGCTLQASQTTYAGISYTFAVPPNPNASTSIPKVTAAVVVRTVTATGDPVIIRDTGASFPLLASATGTVQTVAAAAFTPASANPLIVVTVALENFNGTSFVSNTVSWSGGTPTGASAFTKRIEGISTGTTNCISQVWTATGPNAGVSGTVTSSAGASSTQGAISLMVDALVNAQSTVGVSNSVFHSTSGANSIVLTGVTAGSWLYVANGDEGAALTPVASTTEVQETIDANSARAAIGANTTKTSGNITVGWTGNTGYNTVAALEILVTAAANPNGSTSAPKVTATIVTRTVTASSGSTTSAPKVTASVVVRTVTATAGAGIVNASTSAPKVTVTTTVRTVTASGGATTSAPKITAATVSRTVTGIGGATTSVPKVTATTVTRSVSASGGATTSTPKVTASTVTRSVSGSGSATTSAPKVTVSVVTRSVTGSAAGGAVNASTSAPKATASVVTRAVTASGGATTSAPRVSVSTQVRVCSATGSATTSAPKVSVSVVVRSVTASSTVAPSPSLYPRPRIPLAASASQVGVETSSHRAGLLSSRRRAPLSSTTTRAGLPATRHPINVR